MHVDVDIVVDVILDAEVQSEKHVDIHRAEPIRWLPRLLPLSVPIPYMEIKSNDKQLENIRKLLFSIEEVFLSYVFVLFTFFTNRF